jgi:O-antigen/teichoic acid export membrane protein
MSLKKQTFSGVRWTTISSLGRAGLQFLQLAIMARLLAPADFGMISMVIAIMAFLQIFADAGISNAIIHYQVIGQEQLSSLYWLNVWMSVFLAFILAISSNWISAWYQQPQLQYLLILAAATMIVTAFGQQLRVVAQKKLRFAELAKVELVGAVTGFCIAVALAFAGLGIYALMAGALSTALVVCLLAWKILSGGWRPLIRLRLGEIRQFIKFGAYMIGNNLANTFNSQIDILLGGRLLGAHGIGLYSVPKDLNMRIGGVINPIITQVVLPIMSKAQADEAVLKRVYLHTLRMTASVNFPIYVLLAAFAPEVVFLLLGEQWVNAIPLMRIFAILALLRSIGNPIGSLLMAKGRADLSFKWNMIWLLIYPPVIWLSSQFGEIGMAAAMLILAIVAYWPNWYFMVRPLCGARWGEYSLQLLTPLVISVTAGLFALASVSIFEDELVRFVTGMAISFLVYFGMSIKFNRIFCKYMMEIIGK